MKDVIIYFKGDRAKYTGNTIVKYNTIWYEIVLLEGHMKGQKKVTSKKPS